MRLIVSVIVTDLEKDEPTIFILQKVTDEQVERAFCLRIYVLLREDLVEFVDRLKHSRVRIRHAFHNDAAFFVVGIHSEDVVEEVGSESLLHARHKLLMCLFVIFECRFALLRLCCIIPLLELVNLVEQLSLLLFLLFMNHDRLAPDCRGILALEWRSFLSLHGGLS